MCDKHKYTMIFFDQDQTDKVSPKNQDLVEIKDPKKVAAIKKSLIKC